MTRIALKGQIILGTALSPIHIVKTGYDEDDINIDRMRGVAVTNGFSRGWIWARGGKGLKEHKVEVGQGSSRAKR